MKIWYFKNTVCLSIYASEKSSFHLFAIRLKYLYEKGLRALVINVKICYIFLLWFRLLWKDFFAVILWLKYDSELLCFIYNSFGLYIFLLG